MKNKYLLFLVISPLFSLFLISMLVLYLLYGWTYQGPNKEFEVKSGEGFASINFRLHQEGLISNKKVFYRLALYTDQIKNLKPGIYTISSGVNSTQVLDLLLKGKKDQLTLTIPEGKNIYEIAKILEQLNIATAENFINLAKNSEFTSSLGISANTVEGYLYPETYHFDKGTSAQTIIKTMVQEFNKKTSHLNFQENQLSKHQIVTLASIVEKETGAAFERPKIAGVFFNRIRKKMRLQSDPTTIYGIFETFDGNLRKKHLFEETPYNTYKIPGLPIGPIANPGLAAITATLNPEKHDYLFFVSLNDGTHIFTKNYKEHLRAVEEFQKNPSSRKGKSWRDLNKKEQQSTQ